MAKLYSNENFDFKVVEILRSFTHDVLTSKEAGNANQAISDEEVLTFAIAEKRAIVTFNYQDFKMLHRLSPEHNGIIICTEDKDIPALALRIHQAIELAQGDLDQKLIRINRPNPSTFKTNP